MKKFILLIGLGATMLATEAAPRSFSVPAPGWSKVAVCNEEEGINIRKTPSTSSPRFISRCEDPYDYWNTTEFWGSPNQKENETVMTFNGSAPVLSEQNGWYELYGIGPNGSNGWVSAQYCEVEEPRALKPGQYNTSDFVWLNNKEDGNYAIFCEFIEMDGYSTFYVGRESNGVLVCEYAFSCNAHYEPDKTPGATQINMNDGGEEWTMISFSYGDSESTRNGFDLSKFSEKALESIVDCAVKMEKPVYVYRLNGVYRHT